MQAAEYPTSTTCMISSLTTTTTDDPPTYEFEDDPIETTTNIIPTQLTPYAYKYRITLPISSPASYGLLLLANRQAAWTTPIPENFIPTHLPNDIRQRLLQETPTIIRTNTTPPKPARDTCSIYSPAFAGLTPTKYLIYLRAATLDTLYKLLTADEYKQPHDTNTMAAHLSLPTQALLQAIDSIPPATTWGTPGQANTITFTPT
jgi:hypothetical protein